MNRGKDCHIVLFLLVSSFIYFLLRGEQKVSMVTMLTLFLRGYRGHLALKEQILWE